MAPVPVLHGRSASGGAEPSSMATFNVAGLGGGRLRVGGVGARGAALSGRARGDQPRGDGHRRGGAVRGDASDGASLVASVRGRGSGRSGRWVGAAVVVSASDATSGGGRDRGVAPVQPGLGSSLDPVPVGTRRGRAGAGAVVDLSVSGGGSVVSLRSSRQAGAIGRKSWTSTTFAEVRATIVGLDGHASMCAPTSSSQAPDTE